ncbi:uncharacterized protein MONBRDRAFT_22277 [Monosiga brevicollis MX1]|uniref:Peptidase M12B domain-containing protein n=1 Tax=Monosiga brevicollis TaxID=81824 RepID=A9UQ38_MONBE|nr:uncharacterized protein MONBRDRAFT_22277 [Monosiga brevicollis MX1]EDQ92979.1 predicted protein [Monosiga brevicollis MX1]|eukprot:XP_001742741.1 hypothetical protein [Monosiga brevicollis MX1]
MFSPAAALLPLVLVLCTARAVTSLQDPPTVVPAPHLELSLFHHEALPFGALTTRARRRRSYDEAAGLMVRLEALNTTLELELEQNQHLFQHGLRVFEVGADRELKRIAIDQENYLFGRVVGQESSSRVWLYMDGDHIHGRIQLADDTIYLEPSTFHYSEDHLQLVVYRKSDLRPDGWRMGQNASSFCDCGQDHLYHNHSAQADPGHGHDHTHDHAHDHADHSHASDLHNAAADNVDPWRAYSLEPESTAKPADIPPRPRLQPPRSRSRRNDASSTYNTCTVTVVADYRFYTHHSSSSASATSSMLSHIDEVDTIFRATTFNSYSGLGVAVDTVIIETTSASDPFSGRSTWPVSDMLRQFSESYDFSDTCLAHLYTREDFDGGTLGLAWVGSPDSNRYGGICYSSSSQSLNTGLTTNINYGNTIPFATTALVSAHEIGHNWGSSHDTSTQCVPSDSEGGKYIMYAVAVDGSDPNNDNFSPCSTASISSVIAAKGDCFIVPPAGRCGNSRLEPGGRDGDTSTTNDNEECDSGGTADNCCNTECKLKSSSYTCSPANDECCSPSTCRGFLQSDNYTCFVPYDYDPQCRALAVCTSDGSGEPACQSPIPAKPEGSVCGNGGRCTGDDNTALTERCITFCERFGAVNCTCSDEEEECSTCCQHNDEYSQADCDNPANFDSLCGCPFIGQSTCMPAIDLIAALESDSRGLPSHCYLDQPPDTSSAYSSNPKLNPSCSGDSCQRIMFQLSGTICSSGYCNFAGSCETPDTGTARFWSNIGDISIDDLARWARENIVGATMIAVFLLWLPISICICRYDHNQRKKNVNYGTKVNVGGTMRHHRKHGHSQRGGSQRASTRRKAPGSSTSVVATAGPKDPSRRKQGSGDRAPRSAAAGKTNKSSSKPTPPAGATTSTATPSSKTPAAAAAAPAASQPKATSGGALPGREPRAQDRQPQKQDKPSSSSRDPYAGRSRQDPRANARSTGAAPATAAAAVASVPATGPSRGGEQPSQARNSGAPKNQRSGQARDPYAKRERRADPYSQRPRDPYANRDRRTDPRTAAATSGAASGRQLPGRPQGAAHGTPLRSNGQTPAAYDARTPRDGRGGRTPLPAQYKRPEHRGPTAGTRQRTESQVDLARQQQERSRAYLERKQQQQQQQQVRRPSSGSSSGARTQFV